MPPVERFAPFDPDTRYSTVTDDAEAEAANDFFVFELQHIVEKVIEKHGVINEDEGTDEISGMHFTIYTIGQEEQQTSIYPVVLIGHEEKESAKVEDIGTQKRPHKLIAPQLIIDEVKKELAKKLQPAN